MTTLADRTVALVRQRFLEFFHDPSPEQWRALQSLADYLQAMAEGTAPARQFTLCDLDPGIGKSQTAAVFIRCLLDSSEHQEAGALIMVNRLAEITRYVKDCYLREDEYAALSSIQHAPEYRELGLTSANVDQARVLFISQQRLALAAECRDFADLSAFYYQGKQRAVRIWDESVCPAIGLRIDRYQLLGLADAFYSLGNREIADWCIETEAKLSKAQDNTIVDLVMPHHDEISLADIRQLFKGRGRIKAAETLWLLADQEVALVRQENRGNSLINFTSALPTDLAPMVILDASGRVRGTYQQWAKHRRTLVRLPGAAKDYSPLTIYRWNQSSSQTAWSPVTDKHRRTVTIDRLVSSVVNIIRTRPPEEPFIIVIHKPKPKLANAEALIRKAVSERPGVLQFIPYGEHTSTNAYAGIPNIIIAATLIYQPAQNEATGRGAAGTSIDREYPKDDLEEIALGEHAHHFYQAICRSSVRKSKGSSCPVTRCWIIGATCWGFTKENLQRTFPGAKVYAYKGTFNERIVPQGKAKSALEFIVEGLEVQPEVPRQSVEDHVSLDKGNYQRLVTKDDRFISALDTEDIELVLSETSRAPNGRRMMVYRYKDHHEKPMSKAA